MKQCKGATIFRLLLPCLMFIPDCGHERSTAASSTGQPTTTLASVAVVPFAIAPQPFPEAPSRPDQEALVRRLAEEATARAERTLVKQHIAETVERVSSRDTATVPVTMTGTVRLPVSLPPRLIGVRASFQRGVFATVDVELQRSDGTVLAREEATLDWNDILWYFGGGKLRRARPLDGVLVDFVRKAVDHAVKRLQRHKLEGAAGGDFRQPKPTGGSRAARSIARSGQQAYDSVGGV